METTKKCFATNSFSPKLLCAQPFWPFSSGITTVLVPNQTGGLPTQT